MSEVEIEDLTQFQSFNDFFTRKLKDGARLIDSNSTALTSPADGAISELGSIQVDQILQAKGHSYSLPSLLAEDMELTSEFMNGSFATIYLSPSDYHRVHMPITGTLCKSIYVPGDLYSVNQTSAAHVHNLFARNERLITIFDTEFGRMAMILVGAMLVSGIETVWAGEAKPDKDAPIITDYEGNKATAPQAIKLNKGEEMGRFKLGSTVILLFPENTLNWQADLEPESCLRLGETIATYQKS